MDYYERLTPIVLSISLEHGNHGKHTISDVICHLFFEQTKRFFYIRVLQSVGATLYYMLHAHPFLLPQIVLHMIHAVSFASGCNSQKIGCDSRTPTGANHSNSALSQPRACGYILFPMLNCFFSIASVVSSTSADNSENIWCRGRCGQWSRLPLRETTLLRRTYFLKINRVSTDSVITGCNFHFGQCLCRQTQNIGLTVKYKEIDQVQLSWRMCAVLAYQVWLKNMKMFYRMRD